MMGDPSGSVRAPLPWQEAAQPISIGDYLCSERDLYRVEEINEERALLEDCTSEELIDIAVEELLVLRRVEPE